MSDVQQFFLSGCGMSMPPQGNTPALGSFVFQKPCTSDNLTPVPRRAVHVISPYKVLTVLFVLFMLPVLGESGEAKLHLQKRGQPPHLFEQQYWPGHWMKRQILGGWLSYKDSFFFFNMLYSLLYTELLSYLLQAGFVYSAFYIAIFFHSKWWSPLLNWMLEFNCWYHDCWVS